VKRTGNELDRSLPHAKQPIAARVLHAIHLPLGVKRHGKWLVDPRGIRLFGYATLRGTDEHGHLAPGRSGSNASTRGGDCNGHHRRAIPRPHPNLHPRSKHHELPHLASRDQALPQLRGPPDDSVGIRIVAALSVATARSTAANRHGRVDRRRNGP
jgi:hypothetical protein